MESNMGSNRYSEHMQVCKGILNRMKDLLSFTDLPPDFNFTSNACDSKNDIDEIDKQLLQLKNAMSSSREINNTITNIKSSNNLEIVKYSNKEIMTSSEKLEIIKSANIEKLNSSETLKIINSSNKEIINSLGKVKIESKNNVKLLYEGNVTNSVSDSKAINSEQLNLSDTYKQSLKENCKAEKKDVSIEVKENGDYKYEENKKIKEEEYDPDDLPYTASFMSLALTGHELNHVESKVKSLCKNKQHTEQEKYNVLRSVFFKERANTNIIDNTCCCFAPINWTKNLNYENNKLKISKFGNRNVVALSMRPSRSNRPTIFAKNRQTFLDMDDDDESLGEEKQDEYDDDTSSDDTSSSGIIDESCNTSAIIEFQPANQLCYDKNKDTGPYVPSKHSLPFEDSRQSFQRLPLFTVEKYIRESENEIENTENEEQKNKKEGDKIQKKDVGKQKEETDEDQVKSEGVEIPKSILIDPSKVFRYKSSLFNSGEIKLCAPDEQTSKCKSVVFQIPKDPNSSSVTRVHPKKKYDKPDKPAPYVCVNEDCEKKKSKLEKLFEQKNFGAASENEIVNYSSYLHLANNASEVEQKCCNYEAEKEKNIFSQCSQNQVKDECCKSLFPYRNIKGEKSTIIEIENPTKKNDQNQFLAKEINDKNECCKYEVVMEKNQTGNVIEVKKRVRSCCKDTLNICCGKNSKVITMQSKNNEITIESKGSRTIVVQNKRKSSDNKTKTVDNTPLETEIEPSKISIETLMTSKVDNYSTSNDSSLKENRKKSGSISRENSSFLTYSCSTSQNNPFASKSVSKSSSKSVSDKNKVNNNKKIRNGGCCSATGGCCGGDNISFKTIADEIRKSRTLHNKPIHKQGLCKKPPENKEKEEKAEEGCCNNQIQPKENAEETDKNQPCVSCKKETCAKDPTMCAEQGCVQPEPKTCAEKQCGIQKVEEKQEHKPCKEFCTPAEIERRKTSVSLISMTGLGDPDLQFSCDSGKCRPRHRFRDWPVEEGEFEVDYEYEARHIVSFASFRGSRYHRGCFNEACIESRPRKWFHFGWFSSLLNKCDFCRKKAEEKRMERLWNRQHSNIARKTNKFDYKKYEAMQQRIYMDSGSDDDFPSLNEESSKRAAHSTMHRLKRKSLIAVIMRKCFLNVVLDSIKKRQRKKYHMHRSGHAVSVQSETNMKLRRKKRRKTKKKNPRKRKKEHVFSSDKSKVTFGATPENTLDTCENPHDPSATCSNPECLDKCGQDYRQSIQTQTEPECSKELDGCQVDVCLQGTNTEQEEKLDEATSTAPLQDGDCMWALAYLRVGNGSNPELFKVIYTAPNDFSARRNNQLILLRDKIR